ncbi:MAG: hypothetical protein H0X65_00050 [Gemmatimonadetes bacterium]|nr:hypothetical protein [Gemmatimonadota bacterium]
MRVSRQEVGTGQHLHVADHLSSAGLKQRYQSARDPVERTHFQVLYLASER